MNLGNIFELAIVLRAIDRATAPVRGVIGEINQAGEAAQEASKNFEGFFVAGEALKSFGESGLEGIKSLIEPTMELDAAQRHLATILPAGAKGMRQLKEVTEAAEKASVAMNVSTEQGIQNVYLGLGAGLKLKDAITNMNVSMAIAKQTGGDLSETGRVLAHVVTNFGDKSASASAQIRKFGDMMNYVVRQGDVKDINEFTSGLTMAMGAAKAANVDFPTLAAVLVGFQKANITGSEAGSGVIEMVQAMAKGFGKLGVPLASFKNGSLDVIGSLQNLKRWLGEGTISVRQFQEISKSLGARGTRLLTLKPEELQQLHDMTNGAQAAGSVNQGLSITMAGLGEQLGRVVQAWTQLKEAIGGPILSPLTQMAGYLVEAVKWMTELAKAHSQIAKFAVTFVAIGSALAFLVGTALVAVAAFAFIPAAVVAALPYIALVGAGIAGVGALILAFHRQVVSALSAVGAFIKGWNIGETLLLALTGPLGLAVVQFIRFGPQVIAAIKTWTAGIFSAGANIVRTLAEGMISALHYPIDAIKSMAEKVRAYLPFSPAKEGPLAELHRVRIVETIAQQIRPGPIAAAMRTAAAAAVVSVPVMVSAAPMVHAAMPLARASMPVLEASTRIRPVVVPLIGDGLIRARPWTDDERGNAWRPPATLAGRTGNILHITVNAPVTINANGGKVDYQRDFERQLEQHRTKILALIESALHDRERTKF